MQSESTASPTPVFKVAIKAGRISSLKTLDLIIVTAYTNKRMYPIGFFFKGSRIRPLFIKSLTQLATVGSTADGQFQLSAVHDDRVPSTAATKSIEG